MMCCLTLSQVICLRQFLVALNCSADTNDGNCTNKTAANNGSKNICDGNSRCKAASEGTSEMQALSWAVGLIVTELVSVLLIAWSLSIIYRLAYSCKVT